VSSISLWVSEAKTTLYEHYLGMYNMYLRRRSSVIFGCSKPLTHPIKNAASAIDALILEEFNGYVQYFTG
jgi:hypothetical protein